MNEILSKIMNMKARVRLHEHDYKAFDPFLDNGDAKVIRAKASLLEQIDAINKDIAVLEKALEILRSNG